MLTEGACLWSGLQSFPIEAFWRALKKIGDERGGSGGRPKEQESDRIIAEGRQRGTRAKCELGWIQEQKHDDGGERRHNEGRPKDRDPFLHCVPPE